MRAWRSPEGFVVELGPSPEPLVTSLAAEIPEGPWRERNEYLRLDSQGRLLGRCGVQVWSIEEELGVSVHAVIEGSLRKLAVSTFHGPVYRVQREQTEILGRLELVHLYLAPLLPFAQNETEPGVVVDYGLGPEVRRAQQILAERLGRWVNAVDVQLLRSLQMFGDLARRRGAVLRPSLDAFLRACMREKEPEAPAPPAPPVPPPPPLRPLADRLEALEKLLQKDAEAWENNDAREIAREQRWAAVEIARSRALLA